MIRYLPKAKKTGDWADCVRAETNRSAFAESTNLVYNNMDQASHVLSFIRKQLELDHLDKSDSFISPPSCLQRLEKRFVVQWMVSLKISDLTSDWLDHADCGDSDLIHELMYFMLSMSPTMQFPSALRQSKELLLDFLTTRAKLVSRTEHVRKNLKADFTYNRATGGPFEVKFVDGRMVKVTHVTGDVAAVPTHILVEPDFTLTNWFSDQLAALCKHPAKHTLKELYTENLGPHRHQLSKQDFQKSVRQLVADKEQRLKTAEEAKPKLAATEVLVESDKKKHENLKLKAKASLKKFREAKELRQQIAISDT